MRLTTLDAAGRRMPSVPVLVTLTVLAAACCLLVPFFPLALLLAALVTLLVRLRRRRGSSSYAALLAGTVVVLCGVAYYYVLPLFMFGAHSEAAMATLAPWRVGAQVIAAASFLALLVFAGRAWTGATGQRRGPWITLISAGLAVAAVLAAGTAWGIGFELADRLEPVPAIVNHALLGSVLAIPCFVVIALAAGILTVAQHAVRPQSR